MRGIDFTEDPLLQGRIFSYLDTQLNRHGGPNFEQLPINRPIASVDNNNRDGAGQNFIHRNKAPCKPKDIASYRRDHTDWLEISRTLSIAAILARLTRLMVEDL